MNEVSSISYICINALQSEVKSLAKQIAQFRKTREQLQQTNSRLTAVKSQNTSMVSSAIAIETMGVAAKAMGSMNQAMGSTQQMQQTMNQFARENEKMNVAEDTWGELMDDFDGKWRSVLQLTVQHGLINIVRCYACVIETCACELDSLSSCINFLN